MTKKQCARCKRIFATDKDFLENTSSWKLDIDKNLYFNCKCGSTLVLPKGKYDWYAPDFLLNDKAKSIFNTLSSFKNFPLLPNIIFEVERMIIDNANNEQIAKKLLTDVKISASIFNIANTINPDSKQKVDSMNHAISILGINLLKKIILTASLESLKLNTQILNQNIIWKEAFLAGTVARLFINKTFDLMLSTDELFLGAALYSATPKLASAILFHDLTDKIYLKTITTKDNTWYDVSETLCEYPSNVLGQIASVLWGFPDYITKIISYTSKNILSSKLNVRECALFALMEMSINLAEIIGNNKKVQIKEQEWFKIDSALLDITIDDVNYIISQIPK